MTEIETEPTAEDVTRRLAGLEALVQKAGLWGGIGAVEFMGDEGEWSSVWRGQATPVAGRVEVWRKGADHPSVSTILWDDVIPADEAWRALWLRRPMPLFGAAVKRDGIRHTYRDIVGDWRDPSEDPVTDPEPVAVDWGLAIEGAATVAVLDELWAEMREERARTGALEKAYRERRAELVEAEWKSDATPFVDMSPISAASVSQRVEGQYLMNGPRQPQDHKPPQNRAARRASKKGRRS